MDKKVLSYLGLAKKAGKVVTGEESCEKCIAGGTAVLVLVASDASDNTKKKFTNKALFYEVSLFIVSDRDELSKAIGMENRPTITVTDKGLGERIKSLLSEDSAGI
jgi:ribosomal protein L7Ae-like RNA K-turn-binding protein